jgi:hypothetical protein
VWESFEDLGRGLGGQERKRSDGSKEKKKKTSLFGGKIDMNFFLKKKYKNLGSFLFLSCVLFVVGGFCSLLLILGFVGRIE